MKHRRIIAVALLALVTGCPSNGRDEELRDSLQVWAHARVFPWQMKAFHAICQLEEKATTSSPLDPTRQLCDGTPEGGRPAPPPSFD